jgi:uncharacterized protein YlxW (UPF0749 family)
MTTRPAAAEPPAAPEQSAGRRRPVWRAVVPAICLLAGLLFAVSARESRGTDLRAPGTADLRDLVRAAELRVQIATGQVAGLEKKVSAATSSAGAGDAQVRREQQRAAPLRPPGGLVAVHGPGVLVVLDDASEAIAGVDPNQQVVHQSDLQAVVNALWAGGAEAMTIAGQRVIATSAVRCVGNTLLLNGEVFSPPFRVAAIGPYRLMSTELDASPGVREFRQAAGYYGLGYTVESMTELRLPAYSGATALRFAQAGP